MLKITAVESGSIAEELDLEMGDVLLRINGHSIRDLVDYHIYGGDEELLLEILKKNGDLWDLELEKDAFEPLGLQLEHPEPAQCGNNCIFCFVHQLPRGMRSSLYIKDEDFRYSYLYGAYLTLTNIDEQDIQRIIEQRLSPLYVSVHATNEELRERMIGRRGPPILQLLERLTSEGIEIHTQIVLCPGYNDGPEMERSLGDLKQLYPGVRSLAIVPVGLTGYRQRLPQLKPPTREEARNVLEMIRRFQEDSLRTAESRFVFAADELYLIAGWDFPSPKEYENYPQLENGVGIIPRFRSEADEVLEAARLLDCPEVSSFTGQSSAEELERFVDALSSRTGVRINLYPVPNKFFGGHVSVTGLLTGKDVIGRLKGQTLGKFLLVPDVVLREGEDLFLDDISLTDLERELGVPVKKIETSPWGLLEALESLECFSS